MSHHTAMVYRIAKRIMMNYFEHIREFLKGDTAEWVFGLVLFVMSLFCVYVLYRIVLKKMRKLAQRTDTKLDDFVIEILRLPVLWLGLWIIFKIFSESLFTGTKYEAGLSKVNDILLILSIGWILIKVVRVLFYYFENRLDTKSDENLTARKSLTKLKIFEGIVIAVIVIIIVSIILMSFEKVRTVGLSLLTSAGIAGIILGFAAQKSLGAMLAGIQIAITQPIRLDDVVIVEGEWGRIEEITMTYIVVRIWDERRLILPVTYFLEKPFQNWTRDSARILGTVYLYVDYALPLKELRQRLQEFVDQHPKWDRRVANIQVTDMKTNYMELRVLLSSANSGLNWDLKVDVREMMIDYINENYPEGFVKTRLSDVE